MLALLCVLVIALTVFGVHFHLKWMRAEGQISDTTFLLRNGWRHALTVDGWIHPLVNGERSSVFSLDDAVRITRESNWQLHQLLNAYRGGDDQC